MKKNLLLAIFVLFGFTLFAQSYIGRDSLFHNPRFYINAGGYFPRVSTELRVDRDGGLGTDIRLEDEFNFLSELSVFRAEGIVRVKERSQFVISFTTLQRGNELKIDEEIQFGDTVFPINAGVAAYFDTYYYALTWRYSFWNKPGWNAGASFGLRFVEFRTGIEATLNDFEPFSAEETFIAPAALIGVHGGAYMAPRLLVRYNLELLRVNIAGIDINIIESQFSTNYYITKNIGVGVAYSTNSYHVNDIPFSKAQGRVEFEFGGFNLFASARF